ncbi:hypothetical protein H0A36_10145 [Endozoicomonas sp. SM1973]|uniref:Uncharacterized protein n=1 Tax=Spartinivicinus marinus TaxID=2994442 RepID=A0A853I915_9GAMM|nr:hypothetical protein [Spartinivicinus marinus]MCX4027457.1 hypothetical protein [Spartinivicinus marinus]NYZ66371.1 hypothetical protein [Spartinivicinus marinus]
MKIYTKLQILLTSHLIFLLFSFFITASTAATDSSKTEKNIKNTASTKVTCSSYFCDYTAKEVSWPREPLKTSQLVPLLYNNYSIKLNSNTSFIAVIDNELIVKLANGSKVSFKKINKKSRPAFNNTKIPTNDIPKFMFEVSKASLSTSTPFYNEKLTLYKIARQVDFKRPDQVTLTRKGNLVAYIIKGEENQFIKSCWVVDIENPNWFLIIDAENNADKTIKYILSHLSTI